MNTRRLHQRWDVGDHDLFLLTSSFLFPSDVPKEQRLQAVRAAILLMPDENREVLQALLYFLRDVTSLVEENQMTPMNLAVCLGPSLFHLSILKNEVLSPRCIHEPMKYTDAHIENLNECVVIVNNWVDTTTTSCKDWINEALCVINLGKIALAVQNK